MNRHQRRSFLVFMLICLSVFVMAAKVDAGTQGSCTNPVTPGNSVRVWENSNLDTSDGNDTWYAMCHLQTAGGYDHLNWVAHTLPGNCHRGVLVGNPTWDDCISSATVWLATSLWRICFYADPNYQNLMYWLQGPVAGQRYAVSVNDQATSMFLTNTGTCP